MSEDISFLCSNLSLNDEENTTISLDPNDLQNLDESLNLVGRILSPRVINFESIASLFKRLWSPRHGLICKPLGDNTLLFQFRNRVDKQKVIDGSPWLFDKALLALSDASAIQIGSQLNITTCPFWIQLHNVPIGLMNKNFATNVANTIGNYIALDVDSDGSTIGRFLRIRVNLDITKPLRRVVKASLHGSDYILPVKYERLPNFCYYCGIIGHGDRDCETRILATTESTTGNLYGPWMRVPQPSNPFASQRPMNPTNRASNISPPNAPHQNPQPPIPNPPADNSPPHHIPLIPQPQHHTPTAFNSSPPLSANHNPVPHQTINPTTNPSDSIRPINLDHLQLPYTNHTSQNTAPSPSPSSPPLSPITIKTSSPINSSIKTQTFSPANTHHTSPIKTSSPQKTSTPLTPSSPFLVPVHMELDSPARKLARRIVSIRRKITASTDPTPQPSSSTKRKLPPSFSITDPISDDPLATSGKKSKAFWVKTKECEEIIKQHWNDSLSPLPAKIENCSIGLLNWSKHQYGDFDKHIDDIKSRITSLKNGPISEETKKEISELQLKLDLSLDQLDIKWKQRAKQHWYKEGDRNTQFFHAFASKRKANNHITKLKDQSGIFQETPEGLERIITDHFGSIFTSSHPSESDIAAAVARLSPKDLQRCQKIHGIAITRSAPSISHLFFADDTLLFGHTTIEEARHIRFAIRLYERISGQLVNLDKSGIYFSRDVDTDTANSILQILGFSRVDTHGKYLGLPSVIGRNKKEMFGYIKDKIWQRIQNWSKHHFSKAGKEILIKSVLQAIPSYAMSCFKFPESVISEIQSMIRGFWWDSASNKKKIHWNSWQSISRKKSEGGIGFRNFRAFNLALLAKQAWRLISNPSSLLARVYKAKYHPSHPFLEAQMHHRPSWTWRSIMDSKKVLLTGCLKRIQSGKNTKVWGDRWIPKYPYHLTCAKPNSVSFSMKVSELINGSSNCWNSELIRTLFPNQVAASILSIPLNVTPRNDSWYWIHNKNGKFSVKSAYQTIMHTPNLSDDFVDPGGTSSGSRPIWKKLWKLKIPAQIIHFTWRILKNSLPTPENLIRRHLPCEPLCPLCKSPDTSAAHLFFLCPSSDKFGISRVSDNPCFISKEPSFALWIRDLIEDSPTSITEFALTICSGIWYSRNKLIFDNQDFLPATIISSAGLILSSFQAANLWPERPSIVLTDLEILRHPPDGTHIFFDGAISTTDNCAGIGVFIRSRTGSFLKGFSKKIQNIINPDEAEQLALREALIIARSEGHSDVSFIGDSRNYRARQSSHPPPLITALPFSISPRFYVD
ncbi:hypothetical protein DH2020_045094 [Rehmannia glutinosa]|uniref:CCHC-type domain-containing protein n=1 Tax=Rehmannia glutinosa TaxID=99300 RepID=A0ABR0UFW3_REHGL